MTQMTARMDYVYGNQKGSGLTRDDPEVQIWMQVFI